MEIEKVLATCSVNATKTRSEETIIERFLGMHSRLVE